jgi:hypothetical protein
MMFGGAQREPVDSSGGDELEPYYRLVELQKQMIDLVQQNEQAQRECAALRARLAREADELYRAHSSVGYRLRKSASGLLRRLWWREFSSRTPNSVRTDLIYRLGVRDIPRQIRRI